VAADGAHCLVFPPPGRGVAGGVTS
jgi:hypothetical protein